MKIKKVYIQYGLIALIILILVVNIICDDKPSEELVNEKKEEFFKVINRKDINRIVVDIKDENGETYRISISNKNIIKKILEASKLDYGKTGKRGGYKQFYFIGLEFEGTIYKFGYVKMDEYNYNSCPKSGVYDRYNDCATVYIYRNSNIPDNIRPQAFTDSVYAFINTDLIPVLREHVDKLKDENPEKYRVELID